MSVLFCPPQQSTGAIRLRRTFKAKEPEPQTQTHPVIRYVANIIDVCATNKASKSAQQQSFATQTEVTFSQ